MAKAMNPVEKDPVYCFDRPIALGMNPPPSAPISPIMLPAIAVVVGQRSGTSWKSEPLPIPRNAKTSMKMAVVAAMRINYFIPISSITP